MKVLLAGFEPFGLENINPSREVVLNFPKIENVEVEKLLLPVSFNRVAPIVKNVIRQVNPNVILMLGQGGGRSGISLERVAINIDHATVSDNDGVCPQNTIISKSGANAYFSTLPISALVNVLKDNSIEAKVSNTAGTYVCNHLFYEVCRYTKRFNPSMQVGFVHLPYLPEQIVNKKDKPSLSLQQDIKAIEILIQQLVKLNVKSD